jgi:hypothetical protein
MFLFFPDSTCAMCTFPSSTNNFAHAQTLSRMSSLSGRMNIAQVNIECFTGCKRIKQRRISFVLGYLRMILWKIKIKLKFVLIVDHTDMCIGKDCRTCTSTCLGSHGDCTCKWCDDSCTFKSISHRKQRPRCEMQWEVNFDNNISTIVWICQSDVSDVNIILVKIVEHVLLPVLVPMVTVHVNGVMIHVHLIVQLHR